MGSKKSIGVAASVAALATLMGAGIATAAAGTVAARPLAQRHASTILTSANQAAFTASAVATPGDHGGGGGGNNGGGNNGGRDDGGHGHDDGGHGGHGGDDGPGHH